MKEESQNPWVAPELEARIVALVLGEASDFECDELNRLIEERPELATLKEQIQNVHGLLLDVATGESISEDDEWKLAAEKRSAVLAVISGDEQTQPTVQLPNRSAIQQSSAKRGVLWSFTKVAAALCVLGLFGGLATLTFLNSRSIGPAQMSQVASGEAHTLDFTDGSAFTLGEDSAPSSGSFIVPGGKNAAAGETRFSTTAPTAGEGLDYTKDSKLALSAIRDAIDGKANPPSPYYVMDDVEYTDPNRALKLPSVTAAPQEAGVSLGQQRAAAAGRFRIGVLPQAGATQGITVDERNFEFERDGDGYRRSGSKPTVPKAGNGDLSFPTFASDSGALDTAGSAEPVRSTVSVPDGGTVLFGGIRRLDEGRSEGGVPDEPTVPSPMTVHNYAEPPIGDETQGVAGGRMAAFGLGTRPGLEEESANPAKPKPEDIAAWESDGRAKSQDAGGFFYWKAPDSARAAKSIPSPTNRPMASRDDSDSTEDLADIDSLKAKAAKENTAMPSDDDIAINGGRGLVHNPSFSLQIPEPMADITVRPAGKAADRRYLAIDVPPPMTGTVVGQPSDELEPETATQFGRWGYAQSDQPTTTTEGEVRHEIQKRAKDSLGELSELSTFHLGTDLDGELPPDDYDKNVERYWNRPLAERDYKPDEVLERRGQLAISGESHWYGYGPPMLEDNSESMTTSPVKKSIAPAGLNETIAADDAYSTFSLHVSDVSFKLARAALAHGEWPEAAKVRIEEFVNAFDYGDPMPRRNEKVACRLEQSIHPFLQQRNLLRVSMRTAAAGRSSNTPLRLTFLLDNSGSMERSDRQQTVRRAFALLAQQLKPIDQVTLISFSRQPRLLADKVSGAESQQLVQLIDDLPSEGGTNIEAALQLAFEKAQEQQVDDAQNRIILLTDGAVNLGDANPESLSRKIAAIRDAGIAFDAAGISAEGLNDEILEALTRQGDGRYYLLDSIEAADDGFARQIAGALRPSAKNVKVQIEFNPKRVGRYKLLGFEKHRLKQEDFRNDTVDAAEMAAAEAGVAVYQFEAKPDGEGDVGSVSVRFRDLSTGQMIENRWPIPYEADAPRPDLAAPSLRIATSAALLAAKLRGEPLGETVDLKTLSNLIAGLPDRERNADRVQQLQLMIQQARQVSGK